MDLFSNPSLEGLWNCSIISAECRVAAGFCLWPRHDLASLGINSHLRLAGATALVICCFELTRCSHFPPLPVRGGWCTQSPTPYSTPPTRPTPPYATPTPKSAPRGSFLFLPCPLIRVYIHISCAERGEDTPRPYGAIPSCKSHFFGFIG